MERETMEQLEERHRPHHPVKRSFLASAGMPVQGQRGLEGLCQWPMFRDGIIKGFRSDLFITFMNDLSFEIDDPQKLKMFVHDSTILVAGRAVEYVNQQLANCLKPISPWIENGKRNPWLSPPNPNWHVCKVKESRSLTMEQR